MIAHLSEYTPDNRFRELVHPVVSHKNMTTRFERVDATRRPSSRFGHPMCRQINSGAVSFFIVKGDAFRAWSAAYDLRLSKSGAAHGLASVGSTPSLAPSSSTSEAPAPLESPLPLNAPPSPVIGSSCGGEDSLPIVELVPTSSTSCPSLPHYRLPLPKFKDGSFRIPP